MSIAIPVNVSPQLRTRLEAAAAKRGLDSADFAGTALEQALRWLESDVWSLTLAETAFLAEALANPPVPTPEMVEEARRYRLLIEER